MPGKPAPSQQQFVAQLAARYCDDAARVMAARSVPPRAQSPRPTVWPRNDNLGRSNGSPASVSDRLSGAGDAVTPGRYLPPRYGRHDAARERYSSADYPALARLDAVLAGPAGNVVRPRPRNDKMHDYTRARAGAAQVEPADAIRSLIGAEYFVQPEPAKTTSGAEKLHALGTLARRLYLKPDTIRRYERSGILPKADHYSTGTGIYRKRLYTEAQIDGLADLYQQEGLFGGRRISRSNFTNRAFDLWARLATEERSG